MQEQDYFSKMNVVAIKELLWSWHPLPSTWKIVPYADKDSIQNADVLVQSNQSGSKKERKLGHIYNFVKDSGKPYIVTESAVFRKNMADPDPGKPGKTYHRFSWTSYFRDEGDYCNENSPSDRWEQVKKDQNLVVKEWRTKGDYVLVLLQRPGDSSLVNLVKKHGSYEGFVEHTLNEIKQNTDRPIKVRMHPSRIDRQRAILQNFDVQISENLQGAGLLSGGAGLQADLDNAWCVVGFNSNGLTESVMEGIPTFSMCPSCMAYDVSNKSLKLIEQPMMFERQQWLNNLAYCQWREDECLAGLPWEHLRKKYA